MDIRPPRLDHSEPMSISLEAPRQHPLGLVFLGRDEPDDALVEAGWQGFLLDIGDKTVLVLAVRELFDEFVLGCHLSLDRYCRVLRGAVNKALTGGGIFPPSPCS